MRCIYRGEGRKVVKMNKKNLLRIVVLVFVFVPSLVLAKTTTDYFEASFISKYSYVDTEGHHGNFEHFTRDSDGEIAYCIEPGVSLSSHKYIGYYDLPLEELGNKVDISKRRLEKISLYAYFGYGYKGHHHGNEWIVATQSLIWKELGRNFEFTSGYHPENPKNYIIDTPKEIEECMEELEELVDEYLESVNFNTDHAIIPFNQSYNFGRMNGFEVTDCENCTYEIKNKELIVTPTSNKSGRVLLEKKADSYDESFIVYASNNGQNIMVHGNIEPLNTSVSFEVTSGKLILKKYDQDNQSCMPKEGGSLKGSIYKLFKEDGTFIKDLEIDDACNATADLLELGNYYVQEYKAGDNYELDPNKYFFEIVKEAPIKEIVVYDKMYLGQVELKKYDIETKSCQSSSSTAVLEGAIYGLYTKEEELVETLVINDKCSALSKKNLLLGDYYIQEIKAPNGYKLDKNKYIFSITKDNAEEMITIQVFDEIFKTRLEIYKNYLYFDDILPEEEAIFEIYEINNMKKVATLNVNENGYTSIELPYGEYVIKQVNGKNGYHFIEDTIFQVNEKNDAKTQMTFLNTPYQGTLEFYKTDLISGVFLENVLIEIYNEKDELIYQGITDASGRIVVENLSYGRYYIVEKRALEDYHLYEERLYFEIQEDKQVVKTFMTNEKIVHVPATGKSTLCCSIVFAFVFWIIGIELILYGKEKN